MVEGRRTKIKAKGFEVMNRCGRSSSSLALCFMLSPSVFRPLAFSMMPLSIIVIMGATSAPAAPAESASTPTRSPSFDVFQSRLVTASDSFAAMFGPVFEFVMGDDGGGSVDCRIVDFEVVLKPGMVDASAPAKG